MEGSGEYTLSADQVRYYVEEGYLVVPGLLRPEEIEELKQDAVAVARGKYPCHRIQPLSPGISDKEALDTLLCIHQPHHISPVMKRYARHARVCAALAGICGAHLPFWDGRVKCMQSMLFIKPPGFQGQAWHQDEAYIPTRDRSLVGAWMALDPATIENGCLWVLPGSHRMGYLYPQKDHKNQDEFDATSESYGFDESREVPVEVAAGSAVFFNGYLLHRSRKNRGQTFRRVLVNHYCNAWSLLPWSLEPGETVATADRRAVLPVVGEDPYAWKGYEAKPDGVWIRSCKAREDLLGEAG